VRGGVGSTGLLMPVSDRPGPHLVLACTVSDCAGLHGVRLMQCITMVPKAAICEFCGSIARCEVVDDTQSVCWTRSCARL
jgi:hypothetical protein